MANLGSLHAGDTVGPFSVLAIGAVRMGAIPIVLCAADGRRFQIDILRRGEAPPDGVASTEALSLFISNSGTRNTPTQQDQGQAAMAIAGILADDERAGLALPSLLTFAERAARHPDGVFHLAV